MRPGVTGCLPAMFPAAANLFLRKTLPPAVLVWNRGVEGHLLGLLMALLLMATVCWAPGEFSGNGFVQALAVSPDGQFMAIRRVTGANELRARKDGQLLTIWPPACTGDCSLALTKSHVYFLGEDGALYARNVCDKEAKQWQRVLGRSIKSMALARTGAGEPEWLCVADAQGAVVKIDDGTGGEQFLTRTRLRPNDRLKAATATSITCFDDSSNACRRISVPDGTVVQELALGTVAHHGRSEMLAVSRDGKALAAVIHGAGIFLWRDGRRIELDALKLDAEPYGVCFSADEKVVVFAGVRWEAIAFAGFDTRTGKHNWTITDSKTSICPQIQGVEASRAFIVWSGLILAGWPDFGLYILDASTGSLSRLSPPSAQPTTGSEPGPEVTGTVQRKQ